MAVTGTEVKCATITKTNAAFAAGADVNVTSTTTSTLSLEAKGKNIVIAVVPSSSADNQALLFKKGTGFAATTDVLIPIEASKVNWIELDTAPFLHVDKRATDVGGDGDDYGYIHVQSRSGLTGKIHVVSTL